MSMQLSTQYSFIIRLLVSKTDIIYSEVSHESEHLEISGYIYLSFIYLKLSGHLYKYNSFVL